MAEYKGITYILKTSRTLNDNSVEVDVEFSRNRTYRYSTFKCIDEETASSEYHTRCQKKIDIFLEKRQRKRSMEEIGKKLYAYFSNPENTELTRAAAINWYTENINIEGAI